MMNEHTFRLLYDGNCPVCCNRAAHLKHLDRAGRIEFIDFRSEADPLPIPLSELEKQIYAILPDGTIISRMDAIREAYRVTGHGWKTAPTGWPLLRPLFDRLYLVIARNRMLLSRLLKIR